MNDKSFIEEKIIDCVVNNTIDNNWSKIQELSQGFSLGDLTPLRSIIEIIVAGVRNNNLDSQIDVLKLKMLDADIPQTELPALIAKVKIKMGVEENTTLSKVPNEKISNTVSKVKAFVGVSMALLQNKYTIAITLLVVLISSLCFPVGFSSKLLLALCLSVIYVLGLILTLYFNPQRVKRYLFLSTIIIVLSVVFTRFIFS